MNEAPAQALATRTLRDCLQAAGERFAAHAPAPLRRIGEFTLKGFLVPQAVFAANPA